MQMHHIHQLLDLSIASMRTVLIHIPSWSHAATQIELVLGLR